MANDPSTRGAGDFTAEIRKAMQPTDGAPIAKSALPASGSGGRRPPGSNEVNSGEPPAKAAPKGDTYQQMMDAHKAYADATTAHAQHLNDTALRSVSGRS